MLRSQICHVKFNLQNLFKKYNGFFALSVQMLFFFVWMKNGVYILKTEGSRHTFVDHWAILVHNHRNQYVLHNSPSNAINILGGNVKIESLQDFLTRYKVLEVYSTDLTENQVIENSSLLFDKPYSTVFFNCHSFVKMVHWDFGQVGQEEKFIWFGFILLSWYLINSK